MNNRESTRILYEWIVILDILDILLFLRIMQPQIFHNTYEWKRMGLPIIQFTEKHEIKLHVFQSLLQFLAKLSKI